MNVGVIISRQEWRHLCYLTVLDYAKFSSPILCRCQQQCVCNQSVNYSELMESILFLIYALCDVTPCHHNLWERFKTALSLVSAGRYQQRANKPWSRENAKYCCSKWHCYYLNYKLVGLRLNYIIMSIWRLIRQNWLWLFVCGHSVCQFHHMICEDTIDTSCGHRRARITYFSKDIMLCFRSRHSVSLLMLLINYKNYSFNLRLASKLSQN